MQQLNILIAVLIFMSSPLYAAEKAVLSEGMVNPGYVEHPAFFKESFLDIREDIKEAAAENRRVLLYFYQDGCPYCKKLITDNFTRKDIVDKSKKHFDIIAINMWGDREVTDLEGKASTEKKYARGMKVQFTPTLLFLDEKGGTVLRINGYYSPDRFLLALDYVSGKHEKTMAFSDYVKQNSKEKASGKLHIESFYLKPEYNLTSKARNNKKPLMIIFEQKNCKDCDELHQDKLKRKKTDELVKKFDVAVIDMWSKQSVITPAGKRVTAADWAKEMNVKYTPSIIFFVDDKEVFRTDAYLRAFHTRMCMDYVLSGGYIKQPNFQRWIEARAEELRHQGEEIDLWK